MRGADRQRAASGSLGGDHPERLREGARHDHRLACRQQLGELLVLEAAAEHDALLAAPRAAVEVARRARRRRELSRKASRWRSGARSARRVLERAPALCDLARRVEIARRERRTEPLEALAIGAEADDDEARVGHALEHQRPSREQQVDALADDQLADERDQRSASGRAARARALPRAVSRAKASVPSPVARSPRGLHGARASARRARARRRRRGRAHAARSARRRRPAGPSRVRRGSSGSSSAAHRLAAVWREPTSTPRAPREALARERQEALGLGLDGVLERAAVDLDRVRAPRRRARGQGSPGPSRGGWPARRRARRARRPRARPRRSRRCSASISCVAAVGERARFDALVAVGHVDRQQAADVRPVDRAAPAPACSRSSRTCKLAVVPVADGVDERLALGVAVLAEQVHLVAELHERGRQPGVVDVRAGPVEQVAVEDEDAHGASLARLRVPPLPRPLR